MGLFDWFKSDADKEIDERVEASIKKFADDQPWYVVDKATGATEQCANWQEANAKAQGLNDELGDYRYSARITE